MTWQDIYEVWHLMARHKIDETWHTYDIDSHHIDETFHISWHDTTQTRHDMTLHYMHSISHDMTLHRRDMTYPSYRLSVHVHHDDSHRIFMTYTLITWWICKDRLYDPYTTHDIWTVYMIHMSCLVYVGRVCVMSMSWHTLSSHDIPPHHSMNMYFKHTVYVIHMLCPYMWWESEWESMSWVWRSWRDERQRSHGIFMT